MAFLAKGDLFGAEDIPKAERFLAFWKCRGGCEYAEFGAYEGVVQAFPEDAYDCHIFDLEKECYQKLMEQYAFAVKERDKPLERNCFDLGHGADNSWKERMRMDGDIIIVDPCYLDKPLDESTAPKLEDYCQYTDIKEYPDYRNRKSETYREEERKWHEAYDAWVSENTVDWDLVGVSPFGSMDCIVHETPGWDWDWSCKVCSGDEELGSFCSYMGLAGIFLLDEVLAYNPEAVGKLKENPHFATIIRDFHGEVWFEREDDKTLILKGSGNLEFYTRQAEHMESMA